MVHMFLLPLIGSFVWWLILNYLHLSPEQARLGFYWIIGSSTALALFLTLMIQVTH
jgi:hypothetical protein